MENNTAMKDFLIHIREKRNILTRDYQNGRADYYVVRIFEMLEAEAFSRLEKEKEQIETAHFIGSMRPSNDPYESALKYYEKTYGSQAPQRLNQVNGKNN